MQKIAQSFTARMLCCILTSLCAFLSLGIVKKGVSMFLNLFCHHKAEYSPSVERELEATGSILGRGVLHGYLER